MQQNRLRMFVDFLFDHFIAERKQSSIRPGIEVITTGPSLANLFAVFSPAVPKPGIFFYNVRLAAAKARRLSGGEALPGKGILSHLDDRNALQMSDY